MDKQNNFPAPSVRPRKPIVDPKSPVASSSATDVSAGRITPKSNNVKKERTITPELRALLSRDFQVLDKQAVQEHGGGVGNTEPISAR